MISRRTTLCSAVALSMSAISSGVGAYALNGTRRDRLESLLNAYQRLFIELNALNGFTTDATAGFDASSSRTAGKLFVHSTALYVPGHPIGFYAKRYDQVLNTSADRLDQGYVKTLPKLAMLAQKIAERRGALVDLRTQYNMRLSSPRGKSATMYQEYEGHAHALSKQIDGLLVEQEQLRRTAYHLAELPLLDALVEARAARAEGRLPSIAWNAPPKRVGSETKSDVHAYLFSRFTKAGDAILAYIG